MGIVSKRGLYQFAMFAWALGVFGSIVAILSGNAEPYVSAAQLPVDGPLQMFGLAAVLVVAGALVINQFEQRSWKRAGKQVNLAPTGRSLVGKPTLEGTIDGHTVRAVTVKRTTGGGGDEGSNKSTFTLVEADLDDAVHSGLILGPPDGSTFDSGAVSMDLSARGETIDDVRYVGDDDLARDVITTRVSDALGRAGDLDAVFAGGTDDIFSDTMPEPDGAIAGAIADKMQAGVENRIPGGPTAVSTEHRGVILDPAELEERAQAVAAVADSLDRAQSADARATEEVA